MLSLKKIIVGAALVAVLPWARGQDDADRSSLSRPMKIALHFYEQGDDLQAMDRFMDILTNGDPAERSMANEYINLITHRMNGGPAGTAAPASGSGAAPAAAPAAIPGKSAADAASPNGGGVVTESASAPALRPARLESVDAGDPAAAKPAAVPAPRGGEMSASNKVLMRKEIKARLRAAQERSLADLKAVDGVRASMREDGDPEAIGIPSALLFQDGISFQRDAARLLEPLTKLVFALGSTQVLILPEGTAMGDAKVLDMRRTMGVSSALDQAGVAPPRVRVNLLNTQVDIPKSLADFKGIVVVFQYDQPMNLSSESPVGDDLGPPVSLGVFPPQIRPARNQGAIIEFSVSDPPAGIQSWKFELLQPSKDGAELAPLQEVVGGGPVFHQIFWNGRQNYFGAPLPPGRYECVLTAIDSKNRQRALHKWIELLPDEGDGEKLLKPAARPEKAAVAEEGQASDETAPAASAPSEDLGASDAPLVKGVKPAAAKASLEISSAAKPKPKSRVVRRGVRAKKAAKRKTVNADASKPGRYDLAFNKNTHQMTPASEKELEKAVGALSSFPLETLQVVGHAAADETDAAALAGLRAKTVAGLLINRYQVDPKKIAMSSSAEGGATVELVLARND